MLDVICHILGVVLLLLGVWIILLDWYVFIFFRFTKSERWKSFSFTLFAGGIFGCAALWLLPPTRKMNIRWHPVFPDSGITLYRTYPVKQFFKFFVVPHRHFPILPNRGENVKNGMHPFTFHPPSLPQRMIYTCSHLCHSGGQRL